jgi:hypothetical protein
VELQPSQVEFVQDLPGIPILPKTLLLLDLMVQEPCVDLREMSQLVLSDLGAALQILRLAGREYGNAEGRPIRIEDCISELGLEACLKAVSAQTFARDGRQHAIAEFWDHSREIAQHSRLVADEMLDGYPEEAYLAGLLHAIGLLPELLGWSESGEADAALVGLRFATRWSLPACVTEFFREVHFTGYPALWSGIVREAHQRANRSSIDCPFEQGLRPHLVWNGTGQPGQANFR